VTRKKPNAVRAKRHPTLVDIAGIAGVAPMTVSRVINQSGYVSEEVRKRVQGAIEKLEYHPNALARSLKSRRTHVVGILISDIANPFSAVLAGSMEEVLLAQGYSAFVSTTGQSSARERASLGAFFDHRVEGVVVATVETMAGNEALERFAGRGMPIVVVGRELNHPAVDCVTANYFKGGSDVAGHLASLGHRRIGFIGASADNADRLRRFQGFVEGLRGHGIEMPDELIAGPGDDFGPGFSTQGDGYAGMKKLLALPRPPSAVFARNDFTAMGALCAARDHGLRVPNDVAIIGFDNVPLAVFTSPSLTTIEQPAVEMGRQAALFLLDRTEAQLERPRREACFDCRLIVRESTVRAGQVFERHA
jgi:DNA-binding LacI/PurR family transcriptional regulator